MRGTPPCRRWDEISRVPRAQGGCAKGSKGSHTKLRGGSATAGRALTAAAAGRAQPGAGQLWKVALPQGIAGLPEPVFKGRKA